MKYLQVAGRIVRLVSQVSSVFVRGLFSKRTAVKRFRQELVRLGIPSDVVNQLTADYRDMVNVNPFRYFPSRR